MKIRTISPLVASLAALAAAPAFAEGEYPRLEGGIVLEIENDNIVDSDDPTAEINDIYATIEIAPSLRFSEATSLNGTFLFEPIRDPGPNDDRFFEDHGFYVEELYLSHDFGAAAVLAGKFDPAFGFAWDAAPGLYGSDFAEDYELTERLGAAIEIPFGFAGGEAAFTLAAFAADRTFLSDSALSNRGDLDEADGGVSNTDAPESFVAALTGETDAFGWNVGLRRQAKGVGDTDDEWGVVAGATTVVGGELEIELLGEVAFFPDFDGGPDSAFYTTVGVAAPVGPVTLSAVYSLRDVENAPTDHLATASAEIEIAEGVTLGAGYRYGREGGGDSHTIGALFVYEFGF